MTKFAGIFLAIALFATSAVAAAAGHQQQTGLLGDAGSSSEIGLKPTPAKPVLVAQTKKKCKGGGLVGAMECVTEQIEGAGSKPDSASSTAPETGVTTKSKQNPDGTRTVIKTDKQGKVISKETVGKEPASASTTDPKSGVTTKSERNPDGTRTVTKTDKNGKLISKETVGKEPASASSTDPETGVTIKSVQNPDGTRTVTKTDAQGNILSREKVR